MKKGRSGQGRENVLQAPGQSISYWDTGANRTRWAYLYLTVVPYSSKNPLTHPTYDPCSVPCAFVDPQLDVISAQEQCLAAEEYGSRFST